MFKFDEVLNRTFKYEYESAQEHINAWNYFSGEIWYRKDKESDVWAYPIHGFFYQEKNQIVIYDGEDVNKSLNEIVIPFNPNVDINKTKAMIAYTYNYMHSLGF